MTVEPGNPMIPDHQIGSLMNPRKWWKITVENTNQYVFSEYVDYVLSDIEKATLFQEDLTACDT